VTEKFLKILMLLPFVWGFSGLLLLKNGDKLMIIAIVISIITTLSKYGCDSIKKNMHDKGLWLVLAITTYTIFSYFYHGASSREVRALLGATLLLWIFPREIMNKKVLKLLIVLGSASLLCSTYYFSFYLDLPREMWPINAIPHGIVGAVITSIALILLIDDQNIRNRIILLLCFSMSIGALLINQTRGVWLSLAVAIVIIICLNVKVKHINWLYTLIILVLLSIVIYAVKPKIEERIKWTQSEITSIQSGKFNTSIGYRLQLWMASPKIIIQRPVLGSGEGHQALADDLVLKGDIPEVLVGIQHYHNQYLDDLVKGGIIGFILLLAMLIYPLYPAPLGVNKQIVITTVTIYSISGLTDVPFNHGITIFMYILLVFTLNIKSDEASR